MRLALLALLAFALLGAADGTASPPMFPTPTTKVASGTWDGKPWTLLASESATTNSFSHCVLLNVEIASQRRGGGGCGGGGLRKPGELLPTSPPAPGFGYGITFNAASACPTFAVFAGLVLANARVVVITLSNGSTAIAPTYESPRGFAQSLRFWATHIPCGSDITSIVGRDRQGSVVARADPHFLPHIGP